MNSKPVILIFDVGKTNKKLVLFDEQYNVISETSVQLPETTDEDGDACEDIKLLTEWLQRSFWQISESPEFEIRAVNFSGYGASFVHLNDCYEPITPLYNYLKPYPRELQQKFYNDYGGEMNVSMQTASPVLGNLNSGMQIYRLKYQQPEVFSQIKYSLHLPQFLSFLISAGVYSDITSIGCHTYLWDFTRNEYHQWVHKEGVILKLPPIYNGNEIVPVTYGDRQLPVGVGLHDSSAALIPYLASFQDPFVLISTGTWCISLNPFNQSPLTVSELKKDCLFYLGYDGRRVKASRLFAGYEHETETRRLAEFFSTDIENYKTLDFNTSFFESMKAEQPPAMDADADFILERSSFGKRSLSSFGSYEEAYHQLIFDLITQQVISTGLILKDSAVKTIFVDGGFSKNPVYMHMLSRAFPGMEVFAASVAQATAMGAALAIHKYWNTQPLPANIIELKKYTASREVIN